MTNRLVIAADTQVHEIAEPYDPGLDAGAALDSAFERARRGDTRVLVKFGGAWCPDCRVTAGMMAIPAIASLLDRRFEVVPVHIGRYDANMDLPARLGLDDGLEGAPAIVITDKTGRILNAGQIYDWRTARERTAQEFADYLSGYAG